MPLHRLREDPGRGQPRRGPAPRANVILLDGCRTVVTMDDASTELADASILIESGVINWVGTGRPPGRGQPDVVDGRGLVAIPGLVNTHHHLYQTLTRVRAQQGGLFDWLRELYPTWAAIDADWERTAAEVGLAELALSGCSTTTDHHYVFPAGVIGLLEAEIDVAAQLGIRFQPCRGSMDLGQSRGGLPPDSVVEDIDTVLDATERAIQRFHDPAPGSMLRIAVGPCSPFSVSPELMRESAALARKRQVRLHTHIAETLDEEAYCLKTFNRRPLELLEDFGFLGPDVWLAHCVHLSSADIHRMAESRTGVAWCPTSNMRLGSGFAPAREMIDAGVSVGIAVDGSASNDSGNLLAEVRQALLTTRARKGAASMTAREALRVATRGGAACLGRDDIGSIEVGKRADIALFAVDDLAHRGAEADPVAALVFCDPGPVRHLFVEGKAVVRDGQVVNLANARLNPPPPLWGRVGVGGSP
ncbi:MAG: 8-oxoguanine deaminase [Chloroflexi bacterium]|nr:MAG: 8-oxoguanine deaminase [Chloroflexota bacterium]